MELATTSQAIVELTPLMFGLVPLVIALVQVVKQVVDLGKYAVLLSLVLGVAGSFLFPAETVAFTVVQGLLLGLTASGLYTGVKGITQ